MYSFFEILFLSVVSTTDNDTDTPSQFLGLIITIVNASLAKDVQHQWRKLNLEKNVLFIERDVLKYPFSLSVLWWAERWSGWLKIKCNFSLTTKYFTPVFAIYSSMVRPIVLMVRRTWECYVASSKFPLVNIGLNINSKLLFTATRLFTVQPSYRHWFNGSTSDHSFYTFEAP